MKRRHKLSENWELRQVGKPDWMKIAKMPAQVADVLLDYGILSEDFKLGWCQEAQWIADCDWEYRYRFHKPEGKYCRLLCKGLDTLVTISLNGKILREHDDFYLPESIDISGQCEEENELIFQFHSVKKWLEKQKLPVHLEGAVLKCKLLRKPLHDFPLKNGPEESNYQGAVPGFTPVGVYDEVVLETWDSAKLWEVDLRTDLDGDAGMLSFSVKGSDDKDGPVGIRMQVEQDGELICSEEKIVKCAGKQFHEKGCIKISRPRLWWPAGFGEHPLYTVRTEIFDPGSGEKQDWCQKQVGFRKVEMPVPLAFIINGKKVRLWGGSMDPIQGYTHCYHRERAMRVFDMVENANMNTLRIWGEGIPLPDEFYEEADRRGILIWQEFFMGYGAYPDSEEYGKKCVAEAEVLVKRLKHHASLLVWCGGNETILGAEYAGKIPFGDWIAKCAFPKLLERLDPGRYYHVNSPYGGEWSNDPRIGDTHTYECEWQYSYRDYPNFISEGLRTAPPARYSLEKIIRGPLWEEGYDTRVTEPGQGIMPENWRQRTHLLANGERYSGDYWEYYDAADADSLLYSFGAAYGMEIKRMGEQVRRGSRQVTSFVNRSKGFFTCKLLDTWPKIFCALIDYFQEGYIPYYATKRMLTPVMVSFAKEDNIRLFAVNDSAEDFRGFVETGIYNLRKEKFLKREIISVKVEQGEFTEVNDLSKYRFFSKDCILYARLMTNEGEEVYTDIDYVDIERHLPFKEPELTVGIEGDILTFSAGRFARCVEILGDCDGDKFGWLFEDNYFDLMPGMTKRVKILGRHKYGIITVKAHYSSKEIVVVYGGRG